MWVGERRRRASGEREREGLVVVTVKESLSKTIRGWRERAPRFVEGSDDGRYVHDRRQPAERALGDQRAPISLATIVSLWNSVLGFRVTYTLNPTP